MLPSLKYVRSRAILDYHILFILNLGADSETLAFQFARVFPMIIAILLLVTYLLVAFVRPNGFECITPEDRQAQAPRL